MTFHSEIIRIQLTMCSSAIISWSNLLTHPLLFRFLTEAAVSNTNYYSTTTTTTIIQVNLHKPAPPLKNCSVLLVQKFAARMPLLTATNTFAIRIRQKALEFSSTVLSTPSLYCTLQYKLLFNKIVSSKGTVLLSLLFIECVCVSLFSHSLCTASFQQSGQNLACGKIVTKGLCRGTTRCVKHGLERDPARSMHYKINKKNII